MLDDAFTGARRPARAIVPLMKSVEIGQDVPNPEWE
jgi:hypothetical protein